MNLWAVVAVIARRAAFGAAHKECAITAANTNTLSTSLHGVKATLAVLVWTLATGLTLLAPTRWLVPQTATPSVPAQLLADA